MTGEQALRVHPKGAAWQAAGSLVAHLEVQLHGCALELAAQRVIHRDVDLGA